MFGRRKKVHAIPEPDANLGKANKGAVLREFAYLDEVSVQSLLVSLVGTLPAEVTSLNSQSNESEVGGTVGASVPSIVKSELTARFTGSSSVSNQVLSRAVSESLFKHLYDLVQADLVWSSNRSSDGQQIDIRRGSLIEIEVELAPDPVYGFNTTMGVFADLAEDYPAIANDPSAALILAESGPITKVLDRLLAGLIPLKSRATGLSVDVTGETPVIVTKPFSAETGGDHIPLHVVGVTEQAKYWRDVRRVLFSQSTFTILGRVGKTGLQPKWTPVKLTEAIRDISPQFPDLITRAGATGYSPSVNTREERNRDALEAALFSYALEATSGQLEYRAAELWRFAHTQRSQADGLILQGKAFDTLDTWLVESAFLTSAPTDRGLRSRARKKSGLLIDSSPESLEDFETISAPLNNNQEALIDLEVVAIYW